MSASSSPHEPHGTTVSALAQRLRQHEKALLSIPGVTGCGVGLAADETSRPVIQVFVSDRKQARSAQQAAGKVVGPREVEVVVMPLPSAD